MVAVAASPNTEPLRGVAAWLAEAHDVAWGCVSDGEILEALEAMPLIRNQIDALAARVANAAERSGAVQRDGSRNAAIWTGANTSGSPAEVRHDLKTIRWLMDFADFHTASVDGVSSRRHIDLLRAADRPLTHMALLRDQEMLIRFTQTLSLAEFDKAIQYWINGADPDGIIPDDQVKRNQLNLRRRSDGTGTVDAELDPLAFTTLHEAVEREIKKLRSHDEETGIRRTTRQLRVAASLALVSRGAQRSDGTMTSPLINLVLGQKLVEQLLQSQADADVEPTPDHDDPNHRCELIDGTPIHPRLALALLGVAELRRIVLDAKGRSLDISHNARSFPQWMRDAALVRTRGQCVERGCDAKYHWLHMDHRQPRSKGGQTRFDNLDPYCSEGKRLKGDTWTQPDGDP